MPTDKERREVARRLRALDVYEFDEGECIDQGDVEGALGIINVDGSWCEADGVMRLADLIEPKREWTCRIGYEYFGKPFFHPLHVYELTCGHDVRLYGDAPKCCPYCGARVVSDHADE